MSNDINELLLKEIRELRTEINEIKATNERVNNHIDFIENVFSSIRVPLFGLLQIVSNIIPTYQLDNGDEFKLDNCD
jgi:hypothetical protein